MVAASIIFSSGRYGWTYPRGKYACIVQIGVKSCDTIGDKYTVWHKPGCNEPPLPQRQKVICMKCPEALIPPSSFTLPPAVELPTVTPPVTPTLLPPVTCTQPVPSQWPPQRPPPANSSTPTPRPIDSTSRYLLYEHLLILHLFLSPTYDKCTIFKTTHTSKNRVNR